MRYSFNDTNPLSLYRRIMADRYCVYEVCPWWKGFVSYDVLTSEYRVAPLGFNILFGLSYRLWRVVKTAGVDAERFIRTQTELREKRDNESVCDF